MTIINTDSRKILKKGFSNLISVVNHAELLKHNSSNGYIDLENLYVIPLQNKLINIELVIVPIIEFNQNGYTNINNFISFKKRINDVRNLNLNMKVKESILYIKLNNSSLNLFLVYREINENN